MFKGKIIKFKEERNSSSKKTEKERELLKESKKNKTKGTRPLLQKYLKFVFHFQA